MYLRAMARATLSMDVKEESATTAASGTALSAATW